MPDLDDLLAADAARSTVSDGPTSAFAPAFARTLGRARHRRRRGIALGAAVVAVAVAGGIAVSTSGPAAQPTNTRLQLAAYDRVVGSVPHHPGTYYVIGPATADRGASCTRVRGSRVTIDRLHPGSARSVSITFPPGQAPRGSYTIQVGGIFKAAPGSYELFACRAR